MKPASHALRRMLAAGCSLSLCAGLLHLPIQAAMDISRLQNRAADFGIRVDSSESGHDPECLVDGDLSTLWVSNGANWPATIRMEAPLDGPRIYKAVFIFESGHSAWSVDAKVSHVINSVEDQPIIDKTINGHSFDNRIEVEWEGGIQPSSLSIELSNPKNGGQPGGYWPALAEIEIYTDKEDEEPEGEIVNVAPSAAISAIGTNGTPANLVDEDYSSLYVFSRGMSTTPDGAWVEAALSQEEEVTSIETAFETLASDPNGFVFTYDILGQAAGQNSWTTLASDQRATRLPGESKKTLEFETPMRLQKVRVLIKNIASTGGDPWPALAELKIFAKRKTTTIDSDNILAGKPVHANRSEATVSRLTDGKTSTLWNAESYPAYADFDLQENYALQDAVIYTPTNGYSQYSVYLSKDGRNFERAIRKTSKDVCPAEGEVYDLSGKEARIVRLYMEYSSAGEKAPAAEFVVHGKPANTEVIPTPEIQVSDFEDSAWNTPITAADTIAEVQGIVERRLGKDYISWFGFELKDSASGYDYYDLDAKEGKIHITGNTGVSLATGLNAWLKDYAHINLSQVGDQARMSESILLPSEKIHKETKYPVRYSYNYCTLSYSMAFWNEEQWRNELDWLALNGVNVVLDATGEEEVWRRFLLECGYSLAEIKDFIAGPAYSAWFYMANMSGLGGPLPDAWFEERTELARKNHQIMERFGMQPVLQGYCGMVPEDFASKNPGAKVIAQPKWCGFQRPYMLKTDDACFFEYAKKYYAAQQSVFGKDATRYYATDPFHEGGNTGGMNVTTIAQNTLKAMMDADEDAVWIIQSWQGNPSNALLAGLEGNREHALVLDLYAERTPHWNATSGYGEGEFADTPWVFCMLNNFGGRLGLYGHLDALNENIPQAANTAKHMAGIGIAPEASQNNPLLYDFIFETIWSKDANAPLEVIDLDAWLEDYALRRYGANSESAKESLQILKNTVYNSKTCGSAGQGAPENIVNARPALSINAASTWGYSQIDYNKLHLEKALQLLLADYDLLKDSAGYQYDLVTLAQQVLSNTAQEYLPKIQEAMQEGNLEDFRLWKDKFLSLIDLSDTLLGSQKIYQLGNWTESAGEMVKNPDDFTRDLLDLQAKALITTWGSKAQSSSLNDYSNRQWAGLTKDYYKVRWQMFFDECEKQLKGEAYKTFSADDWFELEYAWVRNSDKHYEREPLDVDLKALASEVVSSYSVKGLNVQEDDSRDLDPARMHAAAGSSETSQEDNRPENVLDGMPGTIWHSSWNGAARDDLWIELSLDEPAMVDGLRYQPRSSGGQNGIITGYRIEVFDESEANASWKTVSEGSWALSSKWKQASFEPVKATRVRLYATASKSTDANNYASAAEIRLTGEWEQTVLNPDLLDLAIAKAESLQEKAVDFDMKSSAALKTAIDAAKTARETAASQSDLDAAARELNEVLLVMRLNVDPKRIPA